uniref:Atrial natriuretic peptide receptor 3-like n=1 Tax=Crassostrea virginica TaxID=6565 RepID=A0A8B8BK34_CRAVI|nr:atrial natriuretic peptide receptor 3-like [Crassostrea virginica]
MILLCFLLAILPGARCETEIQMALLVPNDTFRPFSVDKVLPAVGVAIEKARGIMNVDVNFTVKYADSQCHIGVAINEAIKLRYSGTVHVFFGPVCDYAVAPVARQSKFWNIPVVSVGAMADDFYNFRQLDYPYLTRAGPVIFNNVASGVREVLDYFSWNKFKILYQQNGNGVFEDSCKIMSSTIFYSVTNKKSDHFKIDRDSDLENILTAELGDSYGEGR